MAWQNLKPDLQKSHRLKKLINFIGFLKNINNHIDNLPPSEEGYIQEERIDEELSDSDGLSIGDEFDHVNRNSQ